MIRRTPLRADAAKTAAWQARGRAQGLARSNRPPVARSQLKRSGSLKRARPTQRVTTPPAVWAAALARNGGWCVWARHMGLRCRAEHPHHLLPKGAGGWPQFYATRANIVGLSAAAHMQHEHSPCDRLPWAALPAECQAFLRSVAAVDVRAERFVIVKYPADAALSEHPVRRT